MNKLTFTKQTEKIAFVFFTLYFVYGLFYIPFVQYLVALAVGAISYGITDSAEIAIVAVLAMNFLIPIVSGRKEGFENPINVPAKPTKRTADASNNQLSLGGVASEMSEGFEDANQQDMSLNEKKVAGESHSVGKSTPASTQSGSASESGSTTVDSKDMEKMAAMMKEMLGNMNKDAFTTSKATKISEDVPPVHQPQEKETFQESQNAGGLFKLGQIPKDEKGGHHIDAGTTVMNAINALKPDQIKAMTLDTKQLIETQKSLMGMLQTFQPMVNEGKQMMETFQEMFSPAMGSLKSASAAVST